MGKLGRAKWCLLGCLIVILSLLAGSAFAPYGFTNAVNWVANNDFADKLRGTAEREAVQKDTLIEMVVEHIGISNIDQQPAVILREADGGLYLPILIGPLETNAILVVLEGVEVPRPLTPDLFRSTLDRIGASVDYIVINDLKNYTFYATISVNANWRQMEIDARPSDAIAIALRVSAPVYVEKAVLDKAGIQPGYETDKYFIL